MRKYLFIILTISCCFAQADPKIKILVEPTQDRWIHFPDGVKLRHGFEITHMLNQFLYDLGSYRVQIPQNRGIGIERSLAMVAVDGSEDLEDQLRERLPNSDFNYLLDKFNSISYGTADAHIIVRPRVHTMLYASGRKSNRVVYGFSPERINKYNAGVDGASDNDFVATQFDKVEQCTELDYFGGQMNATGYAYKRSNFGADADEGFSFEIFGFGLSFKKKEFEVKLGVSFDVIVPGYSYVRTFDYEFKAKGKDLAISATYAGINIGFEKQRRFTMKEAIDQGIPILMEEFLKDLPNRIWSSKIRKLSDGAWYLDAGLADGIEEGMMFESQKGNVYAVVRSHAEVSQLLYAIDNPSLPKEGEELRYVSDSGVSPWERNIGVGLNPGLSKIGNSNKAEDLSPVYRKIAGELESLSAPELVEERVGNCTRKKMSWWERFLVSLSSGYAKWRFDNVYDQSFESLAQNQKGKEAYHKVALVSSGVYPFEKSLKNHLDISGYDFISWDNRPSDDLGPGTAAAKLLVEKAKGNFSIVPVKVVGAHGETHSAAIFEALEWLSKRPDIEMVVIPWVPNIKSKAFEEGIELLKSAGKIVVVPETVNIAGIIKASAFSKRYKTKAIHKARVQLAPEGVGVILAAAEKINQWKE